MRKTISLLILSNTGSRTRQLTASKTFVWFCGFALILLLATSGYFIYDYTYLKSSMPRSQLLHAQMAAQSDTIQNQRKQIQVLAGEVNTLKSKLVSLNQFEEKIRIIANIKKTPDQESLFGIGGEIPEDLDINVPLTVDHASLIRDMHDQAEQLDLASINQESEFESLITNLESQQNLLACTPAIQPTTGWVTSGFGYRTSPFTGQREFHKALDIANKEGTPIIAPADGVITSAHSQGLLGKMLVIDHGYGMVTRYGHLKKALKKTGDRVKRGDKIAEVGSTGRTTGPHLHYEVHINGIPVNPKKYILN